MTFSSVCDVMATSLSLSNQAPICLTGRPPPVLEVNVIIICLQGFLYSFSFVVDLSRVPQDATEARECTGTQAGARYRQASADDYSAVLCRKCKFNLDKTHCVHSMNGDENKIQIRFFWGIFTYVTLNI